MCRRNDARDAGEGVKVLADGRRFTGAPPAISICISLHIPLCIWHNELAFAGSLLDGRPHGGGVIDKNGEQAACTFDEGAFVCYNSPKDW